MYQTPNSGLRKRHQQRTERALIVIEHKNAQRALATQYAVQRIHSAATKEK